MKRILFSVLLCFSVALQAQNILDLKLDGSEKGKLLSSLIQTIEAQENARFYFLAEWIQNITIQNDYAGESFGYMLSDVLVGTDLSFFFHVPKGGGTHQGSDSCYFEKECLEYSNYRGQKN